MNLDPKPTWLKITTYTTFLFATVFSLAVGGALIMLIATPVAHAERLGFGLVAGAAALCLWVIHWLLRKVAAEVDNGSTTRR